jgi:Ser/Thr protein kinase RdoA (MazF antagonist)
MCYNKEMYENLNIILEKFNIINAKISILRETKYNLVYKINTDETSYILRVGQKTNIEDIKFETELISYLNMNDFPSPKIIKTKDGDYYFKFEDITAVLFSFIEGKHIEVSKDKLPDAKLVFLVGKELAKFHKISKNFKPTVNKASKFKSELERVIANKDIFKETFLDADLLILDIKDALNFINNSIDEIKIIHNDLRNHNIFFNNKENNIIGIIDYDWSCSGQIIKDVAHTALEWSFPDGINEPNMILFNQLIEGYNSISENKISVDSHIYKWVFVSALSDAATYLSDRINDFSKNNIKSNTNSNMYSKGKYFKNLV